MPFLRVGLANAKPQRQLPIELRVREVEVATVVQALDDGLVYSVSRFVAETDQVQRNRRGKLEAVVILHPICESLRQLHVATNVVLQALYAIVTNHEPQFEGTETAAQLDVPVAVIDHRA